MQVRLYLATAITTLMIAQSSHANTTRFFTATNCLGSAPADNAIVTRLDGGCFNTYAGFFEPNGLICAPLALVALPITGNTNATVNYDSVSVDFLNASMGETVTCTIVVQNAAGTPFLSTTMSSPTSTSSTIPLRGTLTWTGGSLPNGGNAIANVRTQTIFCAIPSRIWENGENCFGVQNFSAVTAYSVNTVGS